MKKYLFALLLFTLSALRLSAQTEGTYDASWKSLANHPQAPEWFQDAKLGIYFHWGVYSVPAFGNEWYPRKMHMEPMAGTKEGAVYQHHLDTYGHPSEFGYDKFVPMFKAEHFDAEEWADLFEKAGAKFAGPVAEHHDGFAMWDSKKTPWNSVDKGPKRNITGEMEKAIRAKDMKFITTFHHARHLQRYHDKIDEELAKTSGKGGFSKSHFPLYEGMPTNSMDPELKYLYGNIPEDEWLEDIWFGKLKEVIDSYNPDMIWFDSFLDQIPEEYQQKFCAYYLNEAQKKGQDVLISSKNHDLPPELCVRDIEKSRENHLAEKTWMTDETITQGSWCYTENIKTKEVPELLHVFIDIVSKNGVLLLNIAPKADGTIPQNQRNALLEMGEWLHANGEAIYSTRPWFRFGEGPTVEPEGGDHNNRKAFRKLKYTPLDVRYTTKDDAVYAIFLGAPATDVKELCLEAFVNEKWNDKADIVSVELLNSDTAIDYNMTDKGLTLSIPHDDLHPIANVYKIQLKK